MAGRGHFIKSSRYVSSDKSNRPRCKNETRGAEASVQCSLAGMGWGDWKGRAIPVYAKDNLDLTVSIMVKP